jgi:hypothetical protein
MSKPELTPAVKNPYDKTVDQFKKLNLENMGLCLEQLTDIYDRELTSETEKLASQVADLKSKQSRLKND